MELEDRPGQSPGTTRSSFLGTQSSALCQALEESAMSPGSQARTEDVSTLPVSEGSWDSPLLNIPFPGGTDRLWTIAIETGSSNDAPLGTEDKTAFRCPVPQPSSRQWRPRKLIPSPPPRSQDPTTKSRCLEGLFLAADTLDSCCSLDISVNTESATPNMAPGEGQS